MKFGQNICTEMSMESILRKSNAAKDDGNYLEALLFAQAAYNMCPIEIRDPGAE